MLQEMDGIVDQHRQVFVLAATNLPENIDPSILSRFTERLVVPLPDLSGPRSSHFSAAIIRFLASSRWACPCETSKTGSPSLSGKQ